MPRALQGRRCGISPALLCASILAMGAACGGKGVRRRGSRPPRKATRGPHHRHLSALSPWVRNTEHTKPPAERTYPPGYWLALLVGGYRASGDYTRPPRDCRDMVTRLERDGCARDAQAEVLPGRLLTPSDVVVARLDDYAAVGLGDDGPPVGWRSARARRPGRAATARTCGARPGDLAELPGNVSLRLESLSGSPVLVADGEHCEPGQSGEECSRAVRLLPLLKDRFVPKALIDADGACMGPAFIPVRGGGRLGGDKRLHFRIETLVTFSPESIVFREQLAIDRGGPRAETARSSYVTRLQVDRRWWCVREISSSTDRRCW